MGKGRKCLSYLPLLVQNTQHPLPEGQKACCCAKSMTDSFQGRNGMAEGHRDEEVLNHGRQEAENKEKGRGVGDTIHVFMSSPQ